MEEDESVEFKTVKACAVALTKALMGAGPETAMVNFLKEEGFINDGVRLSVIDIKSPLSVADKAYLLVEGIKNRIDQDEDSYKLLVDKFKKSGVMYKPIVKKLTKEYEKQYAAANPNMSSAATTSGGSGDGGATGNPSASQPNTAASQRTPKTLPAAAAVDSRTLSMRQTNVDNDNDPISDLNDDLLDVLEEVESLAGKWRGTPKTLPAVDFRTLNLNDDLLDVLEAVESLAGKWRDLCLLLHIKDSTLSVIETNNCKDVRTCLRIALGEWLKWNYDHEKYGQPNWKMLAEAVSRLGDGALSEKIATAHRVREM